DPTDIKETGEAPVQGWVQDVRGVGDVMYLISQDWGYLYNFAGGQASQPSVDLTSVSFADGTANLVETKYFPGYGGVFNVSQNAIVLAHPVLPDGSSSDTSNHTELAYVDITDSAGHFDTRSTITIKGGLNTWGADEGRWNLDYDADDSHDAFVFGC